jgi:hypothetical protein
MTSSGLGQAVWARRPPKTYLSPYLAAGDTFGRTGPPTAVEASMPWSSPTRSTPRALPLVRQFDEVFEGSAESVQPHAVITAIGSLHARGSSADHVRRVRTTRRWSGLWLSGVGRWYERGIGCPRH